MTRTTTAGKASAGDRIIIVEGKAITLEPRQLPLSAIRLDPDNPRIQHVAKLRRAKLGKTGALAQDDLCTLILDQPGVSDLFKQIRDNGGLLEPILVRDDGLVIEGNCRAASILKLHAVQKNEPRWNTISALVFPKIDDRQVAVLQGHFHVAGKNKWRAYEKAGHLHSMHTRLGMNAKEIGQALGMQERVVQRLLKTYETMTKKLLPRVKNGNGLDKWSHFEEFYKNRDLEEFRENPKNVEQFVELVVEGKVKHGADVRKLPKIVAHSNATKALKNGGVEKAIAIVGRADPTVDSVAFRALKDATETLRKLPTKDLQRLRQESKAQKLLRDLHAALTSAARLAGVKLT